MSDSARFGGDENDSGIEDLMALRGGRRTACADAGGTGAATTVRAALAAAGLAGAGALGIPAASAAPAAADPLSPRTVSDLVDATSAWAPVGSASIHPGVLTSTKGGGACTSNFVFTDAVRNTYLGQAGHCSGIGRADETNGCTAGTLPLGTPVTIGSTGITGTMVYNSWLAMRAAKETDADACAYNDFALIKLPAATAGKVNPSVPVFGGPVALNTTGTRVGESVFSYGNSPIRGGLSLLSPKHGTSVGAAGNGWSHSVYTLTPGIPGDSGSAFLDSSGRALGTLSTLSLAPQPLSNQVSDLARQLAYARSHSGIIGLRLVAGTEAYVPDVVPVVGAVTTR